MKKIITLLAAVTLIFGVAGIAAAQNVGTCFTCVAPGTIDRACPVEEQGSCQSQVYDYEDQDLAGDNYCTESKLPRRVLFPICDCETVVQGDTVDISLEILVNGQSGDNGAYWAEFIDSVGGIEMETYSTTDDACEDFTSDLNNRPILTYENEFVGPFRYLTADGNVGSPNTTASVSCSSILASERVTVIEPNIALINQPGAGIAHGYTVLPIDDQANRQYWAINIPHIRFDGEMVQPGDVISVRICTALAIDDPTNSAFTWVDSGGVCAGAGCCCEFELGTLGCCDEGITSQLIYPYATPMNSGSWWYGMVITNLTDDVCEAEVTVYEEDGDTATLTSADVPALSIAARSMAVFNNQQLMQAFAGDIGDAKAWFEVNTDSNVSGFMFIGNDPQGYAMGYLPK